MKLTSEEIEKMVKANLKECREKYPLLDAKTVKNMARKEGVNDCIVQNFKKLYYGCHGDYFYSNNPVDKSIADRFEIQANNFDEFKAMIGAIEDYNDFYPPDVQKNADKYLNIIVIEDCSVKDVFDFSIGRFFGDVFMTIDANFIDEKKRRYLVGNEFFDLEGKDIFDIIKKNVETFAKESICIDIEFERMKDYDVHFVLYWD